MAVRRSAVKRAVEALVQRCDGAEGVVDEVRVAAVVELLLREGAALGALAQQPGEGGAVALGVGGERGPRSPPESLCAQRSTATRLVSEASTVRGSRWVTAMRASGYTAQQGVEAGAGARATSAPSAFRTVDVAGGSGAPGGASRRRASGPAAKSQLLEGGHVVAGRELLAAGRRRTWRRRTPSACVRCRGGCPCRPSFTTVCGQLELAIGQGDSRRDLATPRRGRRSGGGTRAQQLPALGHAMRPDPGWRSWYRGWWYPCGGAPATHQRGCRCSSSRTPGSSRHIAHDLKTDLEDAQEEVDGSASGPSG